MLFTKTAICLSSLLLLVAAQDDSDGAVKALKSSGPGGLTRLPTQTSKLMSRRDLEKRCSGSCEECFGAGYTLCPDSSLYCYLPGDSEYGLDSCPGQDDGSSTATATASDSTATGSSGDSDFCFQEGATCTSCFGPGYLLCPDGVTCYDPNDPTYDTCPNDPTSSGGSGSSGGNGTSGGSSSGDDGSCADLYGTGNVPCGSDSCYNPDIGESCCADGYYCDAGYNCSSTVGKCTPGSGGGATDNGSDSLLTTTSDYTFATSTDGLVFSDSSATATSSSSLSSATSFGSISSDTSDGKVLAVCKGVLLAAGIGALVV